MFNETVDQRSKFFFFIPAFAVLMSFSFWADSAQAQATPITIALPSVSSVPTRYSTVPSRRIPDSRSAAYLRVEGVLDRASRLPQGVTIIAADLVQELNELGVTVIVDATAIDDAWDDAEKLLVPIGEQTLRSALLNLLRRVNATIVISPDGVLSIISNDNMNDPEFLTTILYDVSDLVTTPNEAYSLIDILQTSVGYDSWSDSGTGEGTVEPVQRNGRVILVINTCYSVHRGSQRLFNNYFGMTGGRATTVRVAPVTQKQTARSSGSMAIALPQSKTKAGLRSRRGIALPGQGTTGGFGGRGGGGGGVF